MQSINTPRLRINTASTQRGLVLFIALIALVAMSLAAAALVRSVDSGVLVAGNLAFRQSAILSGDTAISSAYRYINENAASLVSNNGGYYASYDSTQSSDSDLARIKNDAIWNTAFAVPADSYDQTKNEARYIIERMCRKDGAASADECMMGTGSGRASSKGVQDYRNAGAEKGTSGTPVYRITVRVADPRNTFTYLQAFVY